MKIWRTIYRYELKKILQKKFVIVGLLAIYAFIIFGNFIELMGSVYIEDIPYTTKAELNRMDKENALALSGRRIDGALLKEALSSTREYRALIDSFGDSPTMEQKQQLADAHIQIYRPHVGIWNFWQKALGKSLDEMLDFEDGEEAFYAEYHKKLQSTYESLRLSDSEIAYWEEKREQLAAGLTFAAASTAGMIIVSFITAFSMYGTEGFQACLQIYQPLYPYPVSIGRFMVMVWGILVVVILFVSFLVMFLSACFSRSIVPMALIFIRIMLGMFLNIPERLRIPSQIWGWLPINYLFASNIYDTRLFPFFGHYLTSWQILPVLGILIAVAGRSVYKRGRS